MGVLKLFIYCVYFITFVQSYTPPKIEVRSTGIVSKKPPPAVIEGISNGFKTVGVLHGHSVEVICIGERAENLSLYLDPVTKAGEGALLGDEIKLNGKNTNQFTKTYLLSEPVRQISVFSCVCALNIFELDRINVIVDSLPEAVKFSCLWYDRETLTCDWRSPNAIGYYELSRIIDGRPEYSCKARVQELNKCTWSVPSLYENLREEILQFHLHACTYIGCLDKIYQISSLSIMRLDPPPNLKVAEKGFRYVIVTWTTDDISMKHLHPGALEYKIEYWMQGGEPRRVNETPIPWREGPGSYSYRLRINVPCAEKAYEVRVYVKTREANEDLWSRYSSVSFFMEPATHGAVDIDPKCRKPNKVLNKEDMLNKISALREEVLKGLAKLKDRTSYLKV